MKGQRRFVTHFILHKKKVAMELTPAGLYVRQIEQ
jgi:hypothetical protein